MANKFSLMPLLSFLTLFFPLSASAGGVPTEAVTEGRCVAAVLSKTYLSDVSKSPIKYSCVYNCADKEGNVVSIKAIHTFHRTTPAAEMTGLVCQGAIIQVEYINGQIGGDLSEVQGFWSRMSDIPEIKSWALANDVQIPIKARNQMRLKMNQDLVVVSSSYAKIDRVNYPEFAESAAVLKEISTGSEQGEVWLQESLGRIKSGNSTKTKTQNLIDINVFALGKFLL